MLRILSPSRPHQPFLICSRTHTQMYIELNKPLYTAMLFTLARDMTTTTIRASKRMPIKKIRSVTRRVTAEQSARSRMRSSYTIRLSFPFPQIVAFASIPIFNNVTKTP